MRYDDRLEDKHNLKTNSSAQKFLKTFGPIVLAVGILLIVIGFVDVMSSMGSWEGPTLFWCIFLGMPITFVGAVMTNAGYMGHVARYQASQTAPVVKDVTNYMVEGTKESIETIASALTGKMHSETTNICPHCKNKVHKEAKFCDECGKPLTKTCPVCNSSNDGDAKFCAKCGERLY